MPWYKTGTISVTQNSNAVIGTGTAFIANSRVGDGFRGPDGRWYEVTNIASNTALSISPNYEGPTVAGGFYSIMPVQGYQKDLGDQVKAILNDYGGKLAALGTTGNYEILPVTKGGTGGANQADARTGLGLGTSATVNIQTSVTDATAGRAMINGAWGWGAASSINAADLNAITVSQKFGINTGATNVPWALGSTTVPFAAGSSGIALTWGTAHQSQIVVNRVSPMVALRRKNVDVWAPDDYFCLYPTGKTFLDLAQGGTGNTTGTATKLAAAAVVGTVSQTGGVPTGAIIESGSNSQGTYTKFADGTMITVTPNAGPWSLLANSVTVLGPFGLPATFNGSGYSVCVQAAPSATNDTYGVVASYPVTGSSASFVFRNGATAQNLVGIKITCIGRWF